MDTIQIAAILEGSLKAVYGEEAITTTDLEGLIDEGSKLISQDNSIDKLYKAMIDRVRTIVIPGREYQGAEQNMLRDYATWGAILEKIYYEPIAAQENPSWGTYKTGDTDDPFKLTINKVNVKLYSSRTTWEVPYSLQDVMIKTAFLNSEEMIKFISGLHQIAKNSMEVKLENVSNWTRANFIAEKINAENTNVPGIHVIHLLSEYNSLVSSPITSAQSRYDKDYLRYAGNRIADVKVLFKKMTTIFNTESYKRFTPYDSMRITMLSAFDNAIRYNLYSDTWHNEFVTFTGYSTVPYWQGIGTSGSWDSISGIYVKTASGVEVGANNIVGIINDVDAMGVTIWNQRTTSMVNQHNEFTNYWIKADIGLYNDLSENAVVLCND